MILKEFVPCGVWVIGIVDIQIDTYYFLLLVNLVVVMPGFRTKAINPTQKVAGNSHSIFIVINTATCLGFFEIGSFLLVLRHVLRNAIEIFYFLNNQVLKVSRKLGTLNQPLRIFKVINAL